MTVALRAARRRLWLTPLIVAIAFGGFLIGPARQSAAAPPPNDDCTAPQELTVGVPREGDTTEATNDYNAEITPIIDSAPETAVPAAGPDVVYSIALTETIPIVNITVKAPFQASIYAFPVIPGQTFVTDCGRAFAVPGFSFANDGGTLALVNAGAEDGTTWYIVVDSWTADEKGPFEIAASVNTNPLATTFGDNTQAIIGSVLAGIRELNPAITGVTTSLTTALSDKFTEWNYAEGSTRDGFEVFLTLVSEVDQTVVVSYLIDPTSPGASTLPNPVVQSVSLVAGQRKTLRASNPAEGGAGPELDFGTRIEGAAPFQASAILYSNRDVGLGTPTNGVQNIQGEHN